jgi:hypothetical protein
MFLMFLILLIGRLLIAGQGYLNDTDEILYLYLVLHYPSLSHLDIHPFVQGVFDMQGQPPEIAIRVFESFFAYLFSRFTGLPMTHPDSLYVIGLFNILVSLLILYTFFRILIKLGFANSLAFLGTFLLGTLVNMNVYIRHILPYDTALLFQLLALNILLRKDLTDKGIFKAGVLSAIGLTNYFGCFMFVFIHIGLLLLNRSDSLKSRLLKLIVFCAPFVILVLIYEGITRAMTGQSYIKFVLWYTDTINQGSFSEGLNYVFLYFSIVEKWWGITLLLLFFIGLFLISRSSEDRLAKSLLFLGVTAYLAYGSYVVFYQKMVFFGRVLHIYYPFVVLGVLCCIKYQKLVSVNRLIPCMAFFALLNYGFVINDLNKISYPRSVIYQQNLFEVKEKVSFSYHEELFPGLNYKDRKQWFIDSIGRSALPQGKYKLVNFCFFKHHPDDFIATYHEYNINETDSIIYEKIHFQSHPVYTFEYCDREGRNFYLDKKIKVMVIKTKE